jgi:nitrite reductase (NADH) large subunit
MSEPLVVIGNGMAATRLVEELSAQALGRYAIAVIGEESRLAYNRVLLSSVLAGEADAADIELKSAGWWRDGGVTVRYGVPAVKVDVARKTVVLADGKELSFARLVFATGSRPLMLRVPGATLTGVLTFRDVTDIDAMAAAVRRGRKVVVIGGGLLGLEAAYGMARCGAEVTVLHLMDRLMERQLDERAAAMLKAAVEEKGIHVVLKADTESFVGDYRVEGVALNDGRTIAADTVIVAAGIAPNTALARDAGLTIGRGIVVDDRLETSVPGIHALGECAEHRGLCYGLVEPAYEQAKVLARHLAGKEAGYDGSLLATNLKVSGVHVFSAGDFMGAAGSECLIFSDPGAGTYKKLVISQGRLTGAVLFGDTADGLWYLDLIRSGAPVETFRSDLIFGRALVERVAA